RGEQRRIFREIVGGHLPVIELDERFRVDRQIAAANGRDDRAKALFLSDGVHVLEYRSDTKRSAALTSDAPRRGNRGSASRRAGCACARIRATAGCRDTAIRAARR